MNLVQLFSWKEEALRELEKSMSNMSFSSEEERINYYNSAVDGIITFYTLAMKELHEAA